MSKNKFNPLLSSAILAAVFTAGTASASNPSLMTSSEASSSGYTMPAANSEGQFRYIIRFKAPALAAYQGTGEMAMPARLANGKIDMKSPAATAYVSHLKQQQDLFVNELSSALGRSVSPLLSFQHAYNGMAINLKGNEVSLVKSISSVSQVMRDKNYSLNTDAGPQLIGADNVWLGNAPASGMALGEGMVIATIDTGTNFDHPSFADVGDDGYDHVNPLGSGNYLGVCDATNTDQYIADYTCNDKLIGGYDFIHDLVPDDGSFDIPGPEDESGHGSHTASTSGGNKVTGDFVGITGIQMSGVAPHATNIIFDVCFNSVQPGGCAGAATIASVDQIIADGLADVINYSISGGNSPWLDPVSEAFLNATDSGVFVTTSAGNSGPGPGTLGHVEPWTTSVGWMTHSRRFSNALTVTGTDPVPMNLTGALAIQGTGPAMTMNMTGAYVYSGTVDAANVEGCDPFPADAFLGITALISRGGCSFRDKVENATVAGATGVIVHNNAPGDPIVMGGLNADPGANPPTVDTTIPSVMVAQQIGLDMVAYLTGDATAMADVDFNTSISLDGQADMMARGSSRGPSPYEYNKPDVGAPGQSILAAYNDDTVLPDGVVEYNAISGTSMASPHTAGAATLLRELKPNWTPMEVKSALMMTAKKAGNTKEDGVTPTDHWDDGAGRVQVDVASSTGLVMHATAFKMQNANPDDGGDPKTINAPNLTNFECIGTCSFQRTLRSVASAPVTYNASLMNLPGTVNPAQFTVNPGQSVTLNIDVDGSALPAGAASMGELMISEEPTSFNTVPFNVPTNLDLSTVDDGYDGSLASMLCETITVSGINSSVFSSELDVDMSHSWPGDLAIKLLNPAGGVLGLMSRPGADEAADDGVDPPFGNGTDIEVGSTLSFMDGAADSAEDLVGCVAANTCEVSPAPGAIAGAANLQGLSTGSANGDWQLCVGDSAAGDNGFVTDITLNILEGVTTVPALHMPAVIVGFPEAPEIDVTPTSLAATLDADMTTDLTLNIANLPTAGTDLTWQIGAGNFSIEYLNQSDASITTGFQAGLYVPSGNAGVYSADDFSSTSAISIESMQFDGFVTTNLALNTVATSINVHIYADDNGLPMGHPEDGLNSAIATLDIPIADGSLDLTDNGIGIDVVAANGGSIDLPAGTYWVSVFPTQTVASDADGRWIWFAAGDEVSGGATQVVSPTIFNLPDWTALAPALGNTAFEQMNAFIAGSAACGAPWMTTSSASGVLSPGSNEDVTVTLDSTGMMPGVYTAGLCIESDDPDEAQVVVPVTLTVDGPSDVIFANGFEAPAP